MDMGFWVKCLVYILTIKVFYVQSFNRQLFGDGAFEGEINNKVCNLVHLLRILLLKIKL